jgi:ribonuclease HI
MQQGKSMRLALVEGSKVVATGGKLSTNNFAEYCGLGLGLKFLSETHWKGELTIMGDSQLVIRQVEGKWKRKNERIIELHARILQRLEELDLAKDGKIDENRCHLVWVPREENTYADRMTQKTYEQYTHKKFPVHRR